ncbi:MAG TPA: DinB family protein [Chitinophaga sp.]|uniref:DinB family protein n=1 Tax=Chitinophaga sp. TaxID=1869181 RepID=UPI002BC25CC9|nr:DinB family protein [Chitinophaga sp.]HVI45678.1 DinB family protein [Chitinophaga sp.]
MKKLSLLLVTVVLMCSFMPGKRHTAVEDRALLISQLQQTKEKLLKDLEGLSDQQLEYKSAPDRWSVIECVEHITLAEKGFLDGVQQLVKQPANPEKRSDVKVTDEGILTMVTDRSHKFKAPDPLQPKHTLGKPTDVIKAFTEQRDKLIDYVTNTTDELRSHISDKMPLGPMDAYQILLLDAAHTTRHTMQLEEVKASEGFPK